jgi:hypothetical protein
MPEGKAPTPQLVEQMRMFEEQQKAAAAARAEQRALRIQLERPGMTLEEAREVERSLWIPSETVHSIRPLTRKALSGDRLYAAQILLLAGLPIRAPVQQTPIRRRTRLGDGTLISVTFSPTDEGIPLPYGSDRLMVFFLTNKAYSQKSNVFRWNCVDEFINFFDLTGDSGGSYRRVQERFIRVAYMHITVEVVEPAMGNEPSKVTMISAPLIDGIRLHGVRVEEGKWAIPETPGKMLAGVDLVRVGENFFNHWLNSEHQPAIPIPMEIFRSKTIRQSARLMDYAIFLYYRSYAAASDSFIPWAMLMEGFEQQRLKDTTRDFREALAELGRLPHPFPLIQADIDPKGLYIKALPIGTEYFKGYPKKLGPPVRS